jgi:hypothetical protein
MNKFNIVSKFTWGAIGLSVIIFLFNITETLCSTKYKAITKEELTSLIHSDYWGDRLSAAQHIPVVFGDDTLGAVKLIFSGLKQEAIMSKSEPNNMGSYLTHSEDIIRQYIYSLAQIGPNISDSLYNIASKLVGIQKTATIIALGFMQDNRVHPDIRNIIINETDLNLRVMAILSIANYKDTNDVPILVQALTDTQKVTVTMDYSMPDGKLTQISYPIRSAANNVLVDMDYEIFKDSATGMVGARKRK